MLHVAVQRNSSDWSVAGRDSSLKETNDIRSRPFSGKVTALDVPLKIGGMGLAREEQRPKWPVESRVVLL